MIFLKKRKWINIYSLLFFISLFYYYYPTNNSGLDAYNYAGCIKYGENLFLAHHLFYNAFLYIVLKPFTYLFDIEVLLFLKIINSSFVVFSLFILYKILKNMEIKENEILTILIGLSFTFTLWRYGTENETYIIPISLSLLASLNFQLFQFSKKNKYIFIAGFFAALASLFHQIHFFWWLGLLIGIYLSQNKIKTLLIYIFPALIVPVSYILVIKLYNNQSLNIQNFIHFILHDYFAGTAKLQFGWKNIFLTLVSTFRLMFQAHPIIIKLLNISYLYILPFILFIFLIFYSIFLFFKKKLFVKKTNSSPLFAHIHILIFFFHFLFALYSMGNNEFMIVLPFLFIISFLGFFQIQQKFLITLFLTLFVWNFSYGIFPNKKYSFYESEKLIHFIQKNENELFIVGNQFIINQYYYFTGKDNFENIVFEGKIKSPAEFNNALKNRSYFYTDLIEKPQLFDRASIISNKSYTIDFKEFKKEKVLTMYGLYGNTKLYKVYVKYKNEAKVFD